MIDEPMMAGLCMDRVLQSESMLTKHINADSRV